MKPSRYFVAFLFASLLSSTSFAQLDFGIEEGEVTEAVDGSPWSGSFAAGLNGKTGNSENIDINATLNLTRRTERGKTALLANYFFSSNDVSTVTDRLFGQARNERKLANPRWARFIQAQYEWDRFKTFDFRIALHGGLTFEVYELDDRFLKLRFGAGASREFGDDSLDLEWVPELQFGGDWERQLNDTVKLFASTDYFPNVSDFADYRLVTNAGLEFVLDAQRDINFRMFALHRYDSTPVAGDQETDLDYGMAISVGF